MIRIKNANNGFVVEITGEEPMSFVCEETNEEWQEEWYKTKNSSSIALGKMLEYIAEYSGTYNYDRWSNTNLKIDFTREGRKYEKPM